MSHVINIFDPGIILVCLKSSKSTATTEEIDNVCSAYILYHLGNNYLL